ncbi:MAG: hypothetical protein JSV96_04215 [Candidatus Aminicenantes bacterium]|nr:MAG: hypothetical protein JSV96_04215 [Candidatus Aminicenantes bacterium]
MKEIITEWRKYLAEANRKTNLNGYLKAKNNFYQWFKKNEEPYRGMIYELPEVVEAAKILIDDDNQQYTSYLKTPDASALEVYNKAVAVVGLNASSKAAIRTAAPTAQTLMQLQQDTYDDFKINLPFLDPSKSRGLHPYWTKSGNAQLGAILQTGADVFLDADSVALLALVVATGGLGAVPGPVGRTFNKLYEIMRLKSTNPNAYNAFQEATNFLANFIQKVRMKLKKGLYMPRGGRRMSGNKNWLEILSAGVDESFSKIVSGDMVNGLEAIFTNHGF